MKFYVVEFIIKDKHCGGLYALRVDAKNGRDAIAQVRDAVYEQTGRNAFTPHAYTEDHEPTKAYTGFPPSKPGWRGA